MARRDERIEHLLRRAGFGASPAGLGEFTELGYQAARDLLVFYELAPDEVDLRIDQPGHVGVSNVGRLHQTARHQQRERTGFRLR